jgi:hypothetical protein
MRHGSLGRAVCRIMLITADPVAEAAGTGIMIRTPISGSASSSA